MPVVRCATCASYVDRETAVRRGILSFCDSECFYNYSLKLKRKRATKARSKTDIPQSVRKQVLDRDKRCRSCGTTQNLHLHHVIYRGQKKGLLEGNHSPNNLLTLCLECHSLVHSNKARYQPLCLALIWLHQVEGRPLQLSSVESLIRRKQ